MPKDSRRYTRACKGCRQLKVQCMFPTAESSTCDRCEKSKRECVFPLRKERSKLSPVVSEIEKKIQALTKELENLKECKQQLTHNASERDELRFEAPFPSIYTDESRPSLSAEPNVRQNNGISETVSTHHKSTSDVRYPSPASKYFSGPWPGVVKTGELSPEMAYAAYDHFILHTLPQFPLLVIPPDTHAARMRQTQPMLFLSILNAASGLFPASVQRSINNELLATFAHLILVEGRKSLELVQALLVGTIWYYAPPQYKSLKYYQYIHCASVMAIDLGLNRKTSSHLESKVGLAEPRSNTSLGVRPALSTSLEARRAWLACYFTSAQTAQNLRRENLIRWTPYLAECLRILSSSPDAAESDTILCRWIYLQRISDEIGNQFLVEQPSSARTLDDPSLHFTLKSFERQIDECSGNSHKDSTVLRMTESFVRVYLNEVALHAGSLHDDMQPPFTDDVLSKMQSVRLNALSWTHIRSLSDCLAHIYAFLDAFITIPVEVLRCQPVFVFVRLMYVLVVLVRLNTFTAIHVEDLQRSQELSQPSNEKIYAYMDKLNDKLREASQENRCASASKFCPAIVSLRQCFTRLSFANTRIAHAKTIEPALGNGDYISATENSTASQLNFEGIGRASFPHPATCQSSRSEIAGNQNTFGSIQTFGSADIGCDEYNPGSEFSQGSIGFDAAFFDDEMLWMLTQSDTSLEVSQWWPNP